MKPKHTQVPMSTKVFFGLGMLAMQMFPAALGVFMVVLVQDFGFDPVMWGLIFFLPRVVDAITDPIMGFISDNTRSRWGRRRQYFCWCDYYGNYLYHDVATLSRKRVDI